MSITNNIRNKRPLQSTNLLLNSTYLFFQENKWHYLENIDLVTILFCLFCTQTSLCKSKLQYYMYRIQQKRDVSPFFREKGLWKYCEDEIVRLNSRVCHQTSNLHWQVDSWHLDLTRKTRWFDEEKTCENSVCKIMAFRPGQGRFSICVWKFLLKVKSISVKLKDCLLNSNLHRQVVNWHRDLTRKTCENSVH